MGKRRGVLCIVALSLSTLALGAAATAARSADTGSFKTAKVKAAGISLQYPRSWTVVALTKKLLAAQVKRLAKKNPKFAQELDAEAQAVVARAAKFAAFDLGAASVAKSNVSVSVARQDRFPSSLDEFTSGLKPILERAGGTVLGTSTVKVSGKTAYRIDTRVRITQPDGTVIKAQSGQLYLTRGGGTAIITVATLADDAGAKLIDRILGSVRRI